MRGIPLAAVLCLAAACGTDPAVAPLSEAATPVGGRGSAFASATCVKAANPTSWIMDIFDCGQKVNVTSMESEITANTISAAIGIWNAGVLKDGLPEFTTGAGSPTITIEWGNEFNLTTSSYHCADSPPSSRRIIIHRSGDKLNCGRAANGTGLRYTNAVLFAGLSRLIAHELSHVIGFKHLSDKATPRAAADHCVASLPANGDANPSLCQAEIELLHYNFGLRGSVVDPAKHIATGFESVSGPTTLTAPSGTGTLTVDKVQFARAAPFPHPLESTLSYSWQSSDETIATVSTSTAYTNTVKAVSQGTTTIHVTLTTPTYEKAVPFAGSDITVTVIAKPPKPTGLAASAVAHSSATIRWVNGATNPGTTTTLQYRQSGAATWTTASDTIPAGATTYGLINLIPLKKYDVRVFHMRDGLSSDITTAAGLFTTPAVPAPPAITKFQVTNCERRPVGTKTFGYYAMAWTSAAAAAGYTLQIGEGTTSSSAGAAVILTLGSGARTAEVGGYLVGPLTSNRWFWIRYFGNGKTGAWTSLVGNPLAVNTCLQM